MRRIVAILAISLTAAFSAAQSNYMNYQGTLTAENGEAMAAGQYKMEVNIYDSPLSGTKVWGPFLFDGGNGSGHAPEVLVLDGGRFNVIMGEADTASRALKTAFLHDSPADRFIELKVEDGAPLLPRQQFLSTPYAMQALKVPGITSVNGNIGVGTNNPQAKLDIAGSLKAAGPVFVQNNLTVGATVSADLVSVANDLTVNGNVTVSGTIHPLSVVFPPEVDSSRPQGNFGDEKVVSLDLSTSKYFCSLAAVTIPTRFYSNSFGFDVTSGCELIQQGGLWQIKVRLDNPDLKCRAACLRFAN